MPYQRQFKYSWVNKAPIAPVQKGRLAVTAAALRAHIIAWSADGAASPKSKAAIDMTGVIENNASLFETTAWMNDSPDDIVAYRFGGFACGLLVLNSDQSDHIRVDAIVVHPGVAYCGTSLLEHALNRCIKKNLPAVLRLTSYDASSVPAYEAMGFVRDDPKSAETEKVTLTLDAKAARDRWQRVGTSWRYLLPEGIGDTYLEAEPYS